MNPPNEFDLKSQYFQGCAGPLPVAAYGNTRAALAQFAYPCRPCCPSMNDVTNPACRIGGDYYHSLSDVNSYDHDGYTLPWWGSNQRCATNCGWWQGLPSAERPPFATQPALNLRRDYEHLNPFTSQTNFPPNRTRAPLPGALPCQQPGQQSCGCACAPDLSYMKYYFSGNKNATLTTRGFILPLANDYAHWIREFIRALRNEEATEHVNVVLSKLAILHRQLASATETDQKDSVVQMLDEFVHRVARLTRAYSTADSETYSDLRTRVYEQGDLLAAALGASQDVWRRYVRSLIEQIESTDMKNTIASFETSQQLAPALFLQT